MNLKFYEEFADSYYEKTYNRTHASWAPWLEQFQVPVQNAQIVDLGSGAGSTLQFLKNQGAKNVIGIDRSEKLNNLVLTNFPDLVIQKKDLRFWVPETNTLDAAFMANVLDELNPVEAQRVLSSIFKGLRSKSPLWVDFSHAEFADTLTLPDQRQKNLYPKDEVASLLYQNGFEIHLEAKAKRNERVGFLAIRL